ncbi:MAG: hypothetical protein OEW16_07200 [Gammaproteobacteria bacterium]|nr:hypothetical protein [Gammaproteobacteria bacterium]
MRDAIIATYVVAAMAHSLVAAGAAPEGHTPPEVVGVTLGSTTIHEAVLEFGPPKATYLAGSESGNTSPDSALILSWETKLSVFGTRDVVLDLVVPPNENTVSKLHIYFPSYKSRRPTVEELAEFLGAGGELVRRPTFEEGTEIGIAECATPSGDVLTLVIPERGLDAYLEANGEHVELLSFSLSRWQEGMPPQCSGGALAN